MKKIVKSVTVFCLVICQILSSAYAMTYSDNGIIYVPGNDETKTLFSQDFENTGASLNGNLTDTTPAAASNAGNYSLKPVLSDFTSSNESSYSAKFTAREKDGKVGYVGGKVFTYLTTETTPAFKTGINYTVSFKGYLKPADANGRNAKIKISWMKGTTTDEISSSAITSGISVKNDEWSDYSASYTVEDGVITDNVTIRFDLENLSADDLFYLDDFKITYNTVEYVKKEVPYISYEDFEGNDIVLGSTPLNNVSASGDSMPSPKREIAETENAHSGNRVFAVSGRGTGLRESTGKIAAGSSGGVKLYNIFNTEKRTPLTDSSSWAKGWEMFTEEDIGKEYEITLWIYADKNGGAFPYGNTQEAIDGRISGENIDVSNEETKPAMTLGLYGPATNTANDSQSYYYGSTPYKYTSKKIDWNTWTEFKIHYTVSADSVYAQNSKGENTLVDCVRVCSSGGGSNYYPSTFYIDDLTVRSVNIEPKFSYVSNNEISADIYVSDLTSENAPGSVLIGAVYNADTKELISVNKFESFGEKELNAKYKVDFSKNMIFKTFLLKKSNIMPYVVSGNYEIPTLNEFKNAASVDRIAQTFYGDVYTQKAFNWYSTGLYKSEICYAENTGNGQNFDNAVYKEATPESERFNDFFGFASTRQRAVLENLKPNTKYYYKVGNKELGVWSDVYEMTTADNTTNDAKFLLMADPQSSTYSAAYPKSVMLEKIMKENPDGEFLMSAGDLIIDPELEDQWITTFGVNSFATPSITNLVAPGNHDTRCEDGHESDETAFAKHFNMPVPESISSGKTYFSVDYKDMHIAVLDTTRLPYDANEDTEQIPWLREDMKNTDKKWKIVLTHISPQTTISVGPEGSGAYRRRKSLQPIFTELGVDLVLAGDSHLYTRTYPFKNCVKNENPTIVKTQTDGGVTTKFYDSSEGVTYVTLGSVSTQTGTYLEESLASVYDVVLTETGCTKEDLYNISTYNIAEIKGDDIIISVYHYDETTGESTLFDKFGITKTNK